MPTTTGTCWSIRLKLHHLCEDMVWNLEQLYTDTMTLFVTHSLMEGKIDDTQKIYEKVRVRDEKTCSMRGTRQIPFTILIVAEFIGDIPKLKMRLEYDLSIGQIQLQPVVKSVVDAAYFGLARFIAVNANTLDDYGGKLISPFAKAFGKAFIKRGNCQKYCGTLECQSEQNKIKSKEY